MESVRTFKLKKLQCRHPHLGNTSLQLVCKGLSAIALFSSTYPFYEDKKTRDKAIKNLSVFLSDSTRDVISKPDMDKLWKGIFYCNTLAPRINFFHFVLNVLYPGFWMSDKPLVQQALAGELSELLLTITSTSSSLAFLRGFWETTVREWNGIDRLRFVVAIFNVNLCRT